MKEDTQWRLRDTEGKEYIIIDSKKVDLQEELNKTIVKRQEEIERLHSIIKEVRELLNQEWYSVLRKETITKVKEIIDKVEEK